MSQATNFSPKSTTNSQPHKSQPVSNFKPYNYQPTHTNQSHFNPQSQNSQQQPSQQQPPQQQPQQQQLPQQQPPQQQPQQQQQPSQQQTSQQQKSLQTDQPPSQNTQQQTAQSDGQEPLTRKRSITAMSNVKTHYVFTNIWKFWLVLVSSQQNSRQYQIEEIFTFKALDYFFHYFRALPKLSELRNVNNKNISLALFKDQIKPAWEDPRNQDGGYYSFTISLLPNRTVIDEIWFHMLLRIIGNSLQEQFKDKIGINGIYMKLKPNNNAFDMQIWVSSEPKHDTDFDRTFITDIIKFCHECSGYDFENSKPQPLFIPFQSKKK